VGAAGTEAKAQNLGRLEVRRRQPAAPLWSVPQATMPFNVNRHAESPHCRHEKVFTFLGNVSTRFGGGLGRWLGLLNSPRLFGLSHSSGDW
jgi:hypothetical protein